MGVKARRGTLAIAAAVAAAAFVTVGSANTGQSKPTRAIDRTLRCTIFPDAGVRQIKLEAQPGIRDNADPSKWKYAPYAEADSYGLPDTIYGGLAAVGAGGRPGEHVR
jgi:hypothetical protein